MTQLFAQLLLILIQTLVIILFVHVILSWVMSPYHPLRQAIGRIVEPFLRPIRQFMPQTGMMDFSPIVLFVLLYLLEAIIRQAFF